MDIRTLSEADVPDAMGLSRQAGWNQVETDWRRLLALTPDLCFGGWVDGELVASTTVTTYPTGGGWVGMVLVDVDHRRQGYGTRIFEHALAETPVETGAEIGLDATDQGRPLYSDYGFEAVRDITRLSGTMPTERSHDSVATIGTEGPDVVGDGFDAIAAYDRDACGTDRAALLAELLSESGTIGFVSRDDGGIEGYAALRPGLDHWQLGPVVADHDDALERLLDAAGARLDGESVIVDSLADGTAAEVLAARNLSTQRELTRMTYPDAVPLLTSDSVVAAAGLELG